MAFEVVSTVDVQPVAVLLPPVGNGALSTIAVFTLNDCSPWALIPTPPLTTEEPEGQVTQFVREEFGPAVHVSRELMRVSTILPLGALL